MSLRLVVCGVVALLGATLAAPVGAAIPSAERDALIALYNSTGGAKWTTNTGWNGAPGTECGWFGVFCDDNQTSVVGIGLNANNLTGTLTPLTAFSNLQGVLFYNNQLHGTIPPFGNLRLLQEYVASNNQLTGPIPSLSGLPDLTSFDVGTNQLSGPFPPISGLAKLERFAIGGNQLSGAVPALANLPALTQLDISDNAFSSNLPALDQLPALQVFYAYTNQFGGQIPSLASAKTLQQFIAAENKLTGPLPPLNGLGNLLLFDVDQNQLSGPLPALSGVGLASLQYFDVSSNQLSDKIPDLSGLSALQNFDVRFNKLTGPVPALSGLVALQRLDLGDNQLSGTIPPFPSLPALQGFSFELNQLTGSLPSLDALPALSYVNVQYNQLSGHLPSLGALKSLQVFSVAANSIDGNIPSLSGLTALQQFQVNYNKFSGHIPDLTGLVALQDLEVQGNQLDGPLPSLAGLSALQQLVINDNQLSGALPPFSGTPNLEGFYAGDNQFTGNIPALTGLPKLQRFYVDANQFDGGVPDLSGLAQLQYFSVSGNKLQGNLPSLAGLSALIYFDASYNQLSGGIPDLASQVNLATLYLGFNQLSGSVPALANAKALQTVAVDDNQLDGTLPSLSGLSKLQTFLAGNNRLHGSVPALAGLTQLVEFNIGMNQFSGHLPSLSGLTNLDVFDASYNQLDGSVPDLAGLGNLEQFYVGFNKLTGQLPALTGLGKLQYFAVDDNQLSGNLPSLTGLSNLIVFLAASNSFEGGVPALTGLTRLQLFQVGNNRLSGNIPAVPSPDNLSGGLSSLCPNNLVPTDNAAWDGATGEQPWYSTCSSNESQEARGAATTKDSTQIAFSRDGAIEVFQSQQTDLTANAANVGGQDVYSFTGNSVKLENIDANGNKLVGVASAPAISPDGNTIAFLFTPGALAKNAKDFATGQIWAGTRGAAKHQVDIGMGGVPANGAAATAPTLSSAAGTTQLAFCSSASNLVPNDSNSGRDIFIANPLDAAAGLQRISVDGTGKELPGDSCEPRLSGDGNNLVFSVSAPTLFGTPARQIVLKKLSAGKVFLTGAFLPITTTGGQGAPADSSEPTLSADGSVVAFSSSANLDGIGAPVGGREVFVSIARSSGRLIKRARSGDGTVPDGASQHPQLTDDGTALVMQTAAKNFLTPKSLDKAAGDVPPPQCGAVVITTNFFSVNALGGPLCTNDGKTLNQSPSISGDGSTSGFDSNAEQGGGGNRNAFAQGVGASPGLPTALSGDYSGQWSDPNQGGQGLVIDVLQPESDNSRRVLLTWFVYSGGAPTWLQGVGRATPGEGTAANTVVVQMQAGILHGKSFPLGDSPAQGTLWGTITLTFADANTGTMSWRTSYPGFSSGSMPIRHFLPVALPASDGAGAAITSCYSGNWYNHAQPGHGFEFEVLFNPPRLTADWFAYGPDGSPVWLFGVGPITGNTAQLTLGIIDGAGAQFPPNYNAATIAVHVWGTATFTFTDAANGSVTWTSTYPGYNSGTQLLQPLAKGSLDRRGCP